MGKLTAEASREGAVLTFLVELWGPGLSQDEIREMDNRMHRAANEMTRSGRLVRYLGSTAAGDTTVIEVVAPTAETAAETVSLAGIAYDRVVESVRFGSARVRGDVCVVACRDGVDRV